MMGGKWGVRRRARRKERSLSGAHRRGRTTCMPVAYPGIATYAQPSDDTVDDDLRAARLLVTWEGPHGC